MGGAAGGSLGGAKWVGVWGGRRWMGGKGGQGCEIARGDWGRVGEEREGEGRGKRECGRVEEGGWAV